MRTDVFRTILAVGITLVLIQFPSCGGEKNPCSGVKTDKTLPDAEPVFNSAGSGFYDFPFPSDLRLTAAGTIDLADFPTGQTGSIGKMILDSYVTRAKEISFGFGLNAPVYFHLSQPILSCSVPAVKDIPSSADPAFLVNLTGTPEFIPLETRWVESSGGDPFLADNLLILLPKAGHPLKSGRAYAAVLTNQIRGKNGKVLTRSANFDNFWAGQNSNLTGTLHLAELKSRLAELGLPEDKVVGLT
ncbi:MAG: hypothetical protein NT056_08700, partial [Proteobacteria bacterium]|nr:hypothetical protein [Pseudomonadota bacterium]